MFVDLFKGLWCGPWTRLWGGPQGCLPSGDQESNQERKETRGKVRLRLRPLLTPPSLGRRGTHAPWHNVQPGHPSLTCSHLTRLS